MVLRLLIDSVHPDETRIAIVDNGRINDFDFVTSAKKQVKGNIYLAKITRVEPSLQAAFVEYGSGKQGFLPFAEIHPDYYQIPMADRERLLKEVEDHEDSDEPDSDEPQATENPPQAKVPEPQPPEPEEVFLNAEPHIIASLSEAPTVYSKPVVELSHEPATEAQPAAPELNLPMPSSQPSAELAMEQTEANSGDSESDTDSGGSEAQTQEVETLANEEDAVRQSRPGSFYRRYKIQEVIKRNQIVLVQVIKEERGNKGVSLTTFMSLAGRYCVLMPNSPKGGGISRKIASGEDRRRLKEISSELKTSRGMSAIIRTAGTDRSKVEIQRDYEYLVKLWETIREQTLSSSAPALIYEEGDIIKRTLRDLYTTDIEEVIVAGEEGYEQAKDFLNMILGNSTSLKLYQDNIPIFHAYNIEDQLNSMYDQTVKLRSGGYIVLNPTEALISIDVNSGRSTGERNIEETATKTNLEAVAEIARQLRLRDLAGLIVIDLIDMADSRNRRTVERAIRDALKMDRAKIQLGRISPFGLLEMSRQRLRPSISETSTAPCPHCLGKGVIRSTNSVSLQIIRTLEKEAASGIAVELRLSVAPEVVLDMLNTRREDLSAIEKKYAIRIVTLADDSIPHGNFRIEKVKTARRNNQNVATQTPVSMNQSIMDTALPVEDNALALENAGEEENTPTPIYSDNNRPRRNRRGGRNRDRQRNFAERNNNPENQNKGQQQESGPSAEPEVLDARANNPSDDRGPRRRPRRWRDKRDRRPEDENAPRHNQDNNHQPSQQHSSPAPTPTQVTAQPNIPPLAQQASQDAKPKKGWWRRIVEA